MSVLSLIDDLNPWNKTAHDFSFSRLDGEPMHLRDFAGRPVLIVNIASLCALSPQLEALEQLYGEFKDQGLVVIGVPSNDFARQEPKSNDEIADYCEARFGVTFHLAQKEHVIGLRQHPFYRWLFGRLGIFGLPTWNFHKILIKPNGKIGFSVPPLLSPDSPLFRAMVRRTIAA